MKMFFSAITFIWVFGLMETGNLTDSCLDLHLEVALSLLHVNMLDNSCLEITILACQFQCTPPRLYIDSHLGTPIQYFKRHPRSTELYSYFRPCISVRLDRHKSGNETAKVVNYLPFKRKTYLKLSIIYRFKTCKVSKSVNFCMKKGKDRFCFTRCYHHSKRESTSYTWCDKI